MQATLRQQTEISIGCADGPVLSNLLVAGSCGDGMDIVCCSFESLLSPFRTTQQKNVNHPKTHQNPHILYKRRLKLTIGENMHRRSVTVYSFSDGHDSGAAIIRDGKVLAALQEERLRNIKNYDGMPEFSMKEVFNIAKVHPSEVDLIAIGNLVPVHAPSRRKFSQASLSLPAESSFNKRIWQAMHLLGYVPFVNGHTFAKLYVKTLHIFAK